MPVAYVSAQDGPRVTVNDFTKSPRVIPRRMISLFQNQFLVDSILRDGGDNFGSVVYEESTPLFAADGSAIKAEFAEYKIVQTQAGIPKVVISLNRGLSILISEDMRRRNQVGRVNTQLIQVRNTLVRDWDGSFRTAIINHPSIPTFPATAFWDITTTNIRKDIIGAKKVVTEAVVPGQPENWFGFNPDTIVMSPTTAQSIVLSDSFNQLYLGGNISDKNLQYTGKLPNQILDLDPLVSRTWPNTEVLICERKTLGFISDERALRATNLYEDPDTETWRSNVSRISAVGVDQPFAAVRLIGVD